MKAFLKVFFRECWYLLKNPRLLVLLIAVPIFVTCLCGSAYEKGYFSDLKIGVVDYSYSKQTREITEAFRQSSYFDVVGYYADEAEVEQAMQNDEIVGCLIFPADFTRNLQLGQQAEVLLGSNASNMGYGSTINIKGSEILGTISTQIAVKSLVAEGETTQDALATMNPVGFYTRQWYNPTNHFGFFLNFGFIAATLQQVLIFLAAASFSREKKEEGFAEIQQTGGGAIAQVTAKCSVYFLIALGTWLVCSLLLCWVYAIPMKGEWQVWLAYSAAFLLSITALGQLFSVLAPDVLLATSMSLVISSPSLVLSGYTFPTVALPAFYQKLAQIFPMTHFSIGYRNMALTGCGFEAVGREVLILTIIGIAALLLTMLLWHRKRKKFSCKYHIE